MSLKQNNSPIQIWGGIECTVNRVGDTYFNQLEKNGHAERIGDLDLIAGLGIKTLRYPVLWELLAPHSLKNIDWSWTDARLHKLKELDINPIVGMVHHGSGPSYTSLTDPDFPKYLSEFAGMVAERYPWIKDFTPVNEPLTTARFSGLYGIWYPHSKDAYTFAVCFLTQCKGIVESMKVIRKTNSSARLIQTEDIGKTYSTPKLEYQAKFENERRWLTFDILCGEVCSSHPMWQYFIFIGVKEEVLEYFLKNKCTPDMIGINHYITSERYLDHRLELYHSSSHGGNGKDHYADIEAVRASAVKRGGLRMILDEVSERYDLPIALTEVHLGCTREEQVRWFMQVYNTVRLMKKKGVNIQAITIWSMFGTYNWNVLLTKDENHYEPGVFDVSIKKSPRPTALAHMVKVLCAGKNYTHPVIKSQGWWQRPERHYTGIEERNTACSPLLLSTVKKKTQKNNKIIPVVITGARGTLGKAFARICDVRGITYKLLTREEMDIADKPAVEKVLGELKPWAVINAAGFVKVDEAESQKDLCLRENAVGPALLAKTCAEIGSEFMTFSTDLVFNGSATSPYMESHAAIPLNIYGLSKREGELKVLKNNSSALIVRTSSFFGPWDHYNFITQALKLISAGNSFKASNDIIISPTYIPDLVNACLDLLLDKESGIWHLSNPSEISWSEFASTVVEKSGLDVSLIKPTPSSELGYLAERPMYSALGSERGLLLPELDHAIHRYIKEMNHW